MKKVKKKTSAITAGVSKSGSPAANRITGTPACTRAVAWSVIATVLEGFTEFTLGLSEISTSIFSDVPPALTITSNLDDCTCLVDSKDLSAQI